MRLEELLQMERVVDEVSEWRHRPGNVYTRDGLALVSKVSAHGRDLKSVVKESVDLIGGVRRALDPGDRVFLKCNFNSEHPSPASTDLPFLAAVVRLLQEEGITDLTVGERSGWPYMPTSRVLTEKGIFEAGRELGFRVIAFDSGPWMDVEPGGQATWWERIPFPSVLKEFDKIVFLPCLKHHRLAGFTMSLKLPVGLLHPTALLHMHADQRFGKTDEPMYQKMIELSVPVGPDLIIMDGRKAFVTQGPAEGETVEPEMVLASGDRIAIDVEGVKILQSYPRDNLLQLPVWEMPLVRRAIELGLGVGSEDEYRIVAPGG